MANQRALTEYYLFHLKADMHSFVADYINTCNDRTDLETKISYIKAILECLTVNDVYDLYDNRFEIHSLLELAYNGDEEKYKSLQDMVDKVIYSNFDRQERLTTSEEEVLDSIQSILPIFEDEMVKETMNLRKLQKTIQNDRPLVKEYKLIHSALKNGTALNKYHEEKIKEFMASKGYDAKKQILILEALRLHNLKTTKHLNTTPKSFVEKMLTTKYKKFTIPEEDELDLVTYKGTALDLAHNISECELKDMDAILTYLPTKEDGYDVRVFQYIYNTILNTLIDELYLSVDDITDLDNYFDKETKNIAIDSYSETYSKYLKVYYQYKEQLVYYPNEVAVNLPSLPEEEVAEREDIGTLVFLDNGDKSYLEKDLKRFPQEYFETISYLLDGKKKGILAEREDTVMTSTNDQLKGFGKLKCDQVRIMYKSLGEGVFLIIGGFVKKGTREMDGYLTLAKRFKSKKNLSKDTLLVTSPEYERSLMEYLDENKRKGSR